ncbi:hypothetical protein L249_5146 [Ophiocordyceps polyrhachis-furcata BCC 54312]|uniref:Uncharacterized protein n=1 Tax=Ophiocordyceps polyrhachis-furcata BCC 54312 TaxID=1330021 RepID=A0A367L3P8_9HYPO|nr:hypothetical protein L249_5146 [Ophiocordyceps polyrhachis-furcata BCC 54312]
MKQEKAIAQPPFPPPIHPMVRPTENAHIVGNVLTIVPSSRHVNALGVSMDSKNIKARDGKISDESVEMIKVGRETDFVSMTRNPQCMIVLFLWSGSTVSELAMIINRMDFISLPVKVSKPYDVIMRINDARLTNQVGETTGLF